MVAVSFNPREGPGVAALKKAGYMERFGRPGTGGPLLTGTEAAITQLTDAVGFQYAWDEDIKHTRTRRASSC